MTQETDRELLELAAKAAGYYVVDRSAPVTLYLASEGCKGGESWNPLADDGDALRLAVKLNLQVNPTIYTNFGPASTAYDGGKGISTVQHGGDGYMATRRAIVCAATEIGRAMT